MEITEEQLKKIGELEGTIHSLNEQIKQLSEEREKIMKENEEYKKTLDTIMESKKQSIIQEIHSILPDFKPEEYSLDQLKAFHDGLFAVSKKKKTPEPVPETHSIEKPNEKITIARALFGSKVI